MSANRTKWSLYLAIFYADQFTGSQMLDPFQQFGYCMSSGGSHNERIRTERSMNE